MNLNKYLRIISCAFLVVVLFFLQFHIIEYFDQKVISERLLSQAMTLTVGDSVSCSDLIEGSKYTVDELEWIAGDDNLLIEEGVRIICDASGETTIVAKKGKEIIAKCEIDIVSRSVISLKSDFTVVGEGLTTQILAHVSGDSSLGVKYSSENPVVAQVNESGIVTAVSSGETRIKISGYGCDSVYFSITVEESPSEVILSAQNMKLGVGENAILTAILPENTYNEIAPVFASSNESVAKVDENGTVTAVGTGECSITATAYSGANSECKVVVGKAPGSVEITVKDDFLYAGETVAAKVNINSGAVCGEYTFSSSNPAIAEVSPEGVITGKGRGDAKITVSTYNGKKASCTVSVQIYDYITPPTSKDIYDAVDYLAKFYPDLISTEVIGSSVKGKDIVLLKLGKGEKKACIVAGLHAKEDIAVAFTMRSIEEYAAAYYSSSGRFGSYNMKKMLNEYTLYIVPLMNPDGLDIVNAGEMPLYTDKLSDSIREKYKSNANGVNLNRNFPFRWDQIISSPKSPDESSYRGDSESSEPETQTIVKLVEENDFEWLFSMHCKGYFVYWADCYNKITNFDRKLVNRLRDVCGFELCGATPLKNLGGGLENWFRYKTGNPGFCVELVGPNYSSEVNKYFSLKTNWTKTKYTFAQGMR